MFYSRQQLRRATLTVCVSILMLALTGICFGQAPAAQTPAATRPVPNTTLPPPKAGGNVSPPGLAAKSTAKAGEAGLTKTAAPRTPPTTIVHNPAPLATAGAASAGGQAVMTRTPKTTTLSESSTAAGRRDPFKAWVAPSSAGRSALELGALPAGTRGLVISGLRLEGIVREQPAEDMIAVVTNHTKRAYFLRVNDAVYNGVVSKITPEAIYFKENTLDPRGRVVTREMEIKLGSAPGEGR
jgi:hypothetical protein